MGVGKGEFTVSVIKEEVVKAMLPMQEHWLPLSNLDLILPPVDVGVFFCYKKPLPASTLGDNGGKPMSFGSMVGTLKSALAQALVSYYAFGGEVAQNSIGEPELLCNNQGVDFVEAVADVELQSLDLYNPDDTIEGKFVPKKKHGVLAVQATSMKCGGIVVACTFDHRIADAYSTNMFLVSWADIARPNRPNGPNTSTQPCFRRSLLTPRRPLSIDTSIDDMYVPITSLPPPNPEPEPEPESDPIISRIYYVTSKQLNLMQSLATPSNGVVSCSKRTKLESFSAFLWKMVAAATTMKTSSFEKGKKVIVKMGVVVDGRKRLRNDDSLGCYFGNVLSIPFGGKPVEELAERSLSWVAEEVHEFLAMAVTKEHFLGLIDWVEAHRPAAGLARVYCGSTAEVGPAVVVSSGQRFPVTRVDFGWGKAVFGSYHFPWGGDSGYVMPMPSPLGNGDWVVYMHLPKSHLDFIHSRAAHVFRPLSWDYLNNLH